MNSISPLNSLPVITGGTTTAEYSIALIASWICANLGKYTLVGALGSSSGWLLWLLSPTIYIPLLIKTPRHLLGETPSQSIENICPFPVSCTWDVCCTSSKVSVLFCTEPRIYMGYFLLSTSGVESINVVSSLPVITAPLSVRSIGKVNVAPISSKVNVPGPIAIGSSEMVSLSSPIAFKIV